VPGNEFAGTVDQVGYGVAGLRPGDEVMGNCRLNAYAEYVVVPAAAVTAKPAGMPWEVAGAFPAAVMTPHIALEEMGVGAGDTLLVHAAAGGVGAVAVQLARIAGATVVGTASEANHDYLRSLGAIPVSYGEGIADRVRAAAPQGIDAVYDASGHDVLELSIELRGGTTERIVTIADFRGFELGIFSAGTGRRFGRQLAGYALLAADGQLRVRIDRSFPLSDAAKAQNLSESGHAHGKLVLRP
jgi:NADPH:quinone reductase-like Zn-dependent oxidoreductase